VSIAERNPRLNSRLRLQRRRRGWSQEEVAAGLHRVAAALGEPEPGVDATMISRWERGTRHPRPRYVRLLCRLFDLPAEELGLVDDDAGSWSPAWSTADEEARRRDFIREMAELFRVAPLPPAANVPRPEPWERLTQALRRPGRIEPATVDALEQVTIALQSLEPTVVSPHLLLGPVVGHLEAITNLLQGSLTPAIRRRLCSLAGQTAGLVGALKWNLDDWDGATAYFRAGMEAAREADDRALGVYLMARAVCRPPHREDPASRLRRLRQGWYGFTPAEARISTQVWLAAKEADAYALLGRTEDCLRALDRAESLLARLDEEEVRPPPPLVSETWLAGERGASLAKLGHTDEARMLLQQVLAKLGPTSDRDRLWLTAALAFTFVTDGEPEEACRVAGPALSHAATTHLQPVLHLLGVDLVRALGPHRGHPAVQELEEQARSLLDRPQLQPVGA
jgi:transcriptional regulator with XRE-family HTH domain